MQRIRKFLKRVRNFLWTTLLGGLLVVLPVAIFMLLFMQIYQVITGLIEPITNLIINFTRISEVLAVVISLTATILLFFSIGLLMKTKFGKWTFEGLENSVFSSMPGYRIVKEVVSQFTGAKKPPFSSVALVDFAENNQLVTAFITDEHEDGRYTVFVPESMNPTNGLVYHLPPQCVHPIDVPIEDAMRSLVSFGGGSDVIIEAYNRQIVGADQEDSS